MIDNFELIKPLLNFESEDDFYFVQILQRKKDNPDGYKGSNNSSRLIKAYYVNSIKYLDKHRDEMIHFAEYFNARVGINLNKRSYYKTAFNSMKNMAELMHNKNFRSVKRVWNTACGVHNGGDKIWLLDVDNKDEDFDRDIQSYINELCSPKYTNKVLANIPSKSGHHIITMGFDTREFRRKYNDVEIHKNNPTNLYIP